MSNFKSKLIQFMAGRYGSDKLYYALIVMYLLLSFIGIVFSVPYLPTFSVLFLAYAVFRTFSRNIYKRRAENALFLKILGKVKAPFLLLRNRIRDRKTKRYRKCPSCRAVLRLPFKKGKHQAVCPHCKKEFGVTIRF